VRTAAAAGALALLAPVLALALGPAAAGDGTPAPNRAFAAPLIGECVAAQRPARVPALAVDGERLARSVAAGHEPGSRPRCRRGELRLLRFEALRIGGERTYVRRGGCALPCVVRQPTVHVPAAALRGRVRLLSRAARNGNGAPRAGCDTIVATAPRRVGRALQRMYYKTPAELRRRRNAGRSGGAGPSWANYGDPGATYRSAGGRRTHYNYLLWNLPRTPRGLLPGGGIVRAVLRAGQRVALCPGTRLQLPSFHRGGKQNGHVEFAYARVRVTLPRGGSYALHGWVLLGYRARGGAFVATVRG
jgi:hypothetical protein